MVYCCFSQILFLLFSKDAPIVTLWTGNMNPNITLSYNFFLGKPVNLVHYLVIFLGGLMTTLYYYICFLSPNPSYSCTPYKWLQITCSASKRHWPSLPATTLPTFKIMTFLLEKNMLIYFCHVGRSNKFISDLFLNL